MNSRTQELVAAVDAVRVSRKRYQDNPNLQAPPLEFHDHVDAMLRVFNAGDIPLEARQLYEAAATVATQSQLFDEAGDANPTNEYWHAMDRLEEVRDSMDRVKHKRRETMAELKEQKVSHEQIARMFGLVDRFGHPEIDKVLQELANPGSVIGPDWVHPDDQKAAADLAAANARLAAERPKPQQPCPESPRELFETGVGIVQAAAMLMVHPESLVAQWAQWQAEKDAADKAAEAKATAEAAPAPLADPPATLPPAAPLTTPPQASTPEEAAPGNAAKFDDPIEEAYKNHSAAQLRSVCEGLGITTRNNETRSQLLAKLRARAEQQAEE